MNVKESNLLTNHPSQIDKHVLKSFFRLLAGSLSWWKLRIYTI